MTEAFQLEIFKLQMILFPLKERNASCIRLSAVNALGNKIQTSVLYVSKLLDRQ